MVPLIQLNEGESGEIVEIVDCCKRHHGKGQCGYKQGWRKRFFSRPEVFSHARMADLGLRIGKKVQLIHKAKQGPLLIKVGDSRIAVGQQMAASIFIKGENETG